MTLALNDAGRLIRSAYPGFTFYSTATFDFGDGGLTMERYTSDPPPG